MKSSQQEIFLNHKAGDLYKIVLDIEKYPEFIPWCNKIIIKSATFNSSEVTINSSQKINKYFLNTYFTNMS